MYLSHCKLHREKPGHHKKGASPHTVSEACGSIKDEETALHLSMFCLLASRAAMAAPTEMVPMQQNKTLPCFSVYLKMAPIHDQKDNLEG